ncbi:NAD(P)-dependent oxidoreductase [Amycolatopsis acidiphila]|uniref:NAD(P)-dependent oxidoreductase n=1 Tax=Amycolatopsis acidiphila TaxID=715473 RepID=A0A558A5A7_9PSEU|nr:NAD(P)-dependent oxidoreductase [Amycolatopsis acidiphila]TVT19436.1 NAD(P)-dependent oxidoreductase [Amycolatopsis acidiphila]UIJ56754.1 NAD(P)-dependent oxidoreductase [Amycolatopsis acidiphila]GHG55325.1 3-hydroxyisobutyrate dehydrogenase [Amycolatopsis acidiphila]
MTDTTVAVLGTGIMGGPMAANLAAAGLKVRAWNRSREKAEQVDGAEVADTPADAVAGADFVLTMLADGPTVHEVAGGALEAVPGDAVWLQTSTVGVEWTGKLAALAEKAGVAFVDAPVLGTKQPAEQGKLVVLASGPDELKDRCAPVFDAIGGRTMWVGPAGAGSKLKLVANAWVLALTNATAESVSLAEQLGVDPELFLESISGGSLDVPYAHLKGGAMISREFPLSFATRHAAKDAQLVLDAAGDALDLGGVRAALGHLKAAMDAGHADEDMATLYYGTRGRQARRGGPARGGDAR